ncbi:MAG: hypothetical protein BIFFINMI_01072 [Phycisphaerae bacterium]|nr:hypothetical protein [Phycisphaerae bacterium]
MGHRTTACIAAAILPMCVAAALAQDDEDEPEPGTVDRPELKIDAVIGRDAPYWRGPHEETPGPLVAGAVAATGVTVSCDRWPDATDLRRFAEDAVRLSNARTDQEKALAVWRWIRRLKVHTDGNPPVNSICGPGRDDDVVRVLNVYGAHYCGGLSRVACQVWRAYGRQADRVHCLSHSMIDLYYTDADGIDRPHLFDVNFGGFLYNRDRTRIAGCDDWAIDYNGSKDNWVHSEHEPWSTHRMELSLRGGEWLTLLWGNEGKPYQQNMDPKRDARRTPLSERGPYTDRTYGNGRWTLSLADAGQLTQAPANMEIAAGRFTPRQAGKPATAVWQVRTPYVISDMQLRMAVRRRSAKDAVRVLLSTDGGKSWQPLWTCNDKVADGPGDVVAELCPKYDVKESTSPPKDFVSPFGRYACLVKLELTAADNPGDCCVESVQCLTWVQQNFYALPQLQPGVNRITVRGDIAQGSAVRITYVWDDAAGKSRRNETIVEKAPFTYEIMAAGRKWEDVVCRVLAIEAMPAQGKGNVTLVKEAPCEAVPLPPMKPADQTRGRAGWWQRDNPKNLPAAGKLVAELDDPARREAALKGLQELRDPAAFDAVAKVAYAERDPMLKGVALATLFGADRARAKPILLDILANPDKVQWTDRPVTKGPADAKQHWADTAVIIGLMGAEAGWKEVLPPLVKVWNSGAMYKHVPWAIMRIVSRIGDAGTPGLADIVRDGLTRGGYTAAWACAAAARLGLRDSIPAVRKVADSRYRAWQVQGIRALGVLGDLQSAPSIRGKLTHWDENLRVAAAAALGDMGDKASADALRTALANEPFAWVRDVIETAIRKLD